MEESIKLFGKFDNIKVYYSGKVEFKNYFNFKLNKTA